MWQVVIILSFYMILGIPGVQCANGTEFTIAVVEYKPSTNQTKNFESYYSAIKSSSNVDFIIFPEATFSQERYEISKTNETPNCSANDVITKIRCLAQEQKTYVIINLSEKIPCNTSEPGCPNSGQLVYNSDVVFGNNGSIMEKYRKWNLFGETNTNVTSQPEIVYIDTEKGKFGIFTCFDILFQVPALSLIELEIENFIFPSMWFSELPFLTALQAQQMWAYENNVNVFGAGANNLIVGSGGSSILKGNQGIINMTIAHNLSDGEYQILTGTISNSSNDDVVPTEDEIDEIGDNLSSFKLIHDNLSEYKSEIINKTESNITKELCDKTGQLCCSFNISLKYDPASDNSEYTHRLVAYVGIRSFSGVYNGGIEICGIVSCTNNSITSCSERLPVYKDISWATTFESITITGTFNNTDSRIQFPNSLLSSIRPISPQFTSWNRTSDGDKTNIMYTLNKPQTRLLTFAIYGRNFANDGPPTPTPKPNSVIRASANSVLILLLTVLAVYYKISK